MDKIKIPHREPEFYTAEGGYHEECAIRCELGVDKDSMCGLDNLYPTEISGGSCPDFKEE